MISIVVVILKCPASSDYLNIKINAINKILPVKKFEHQYFFVETDEVILKINDQKFYKFYDDNINVNFNNINIILFKCKPLNLSFNVDISKLDLIGHRGFGENFSTEDIFTENTLKSFNKALENVSYVEMDVQLTKDRIPIIYHDFKLKNTNNKIMDMQSNECKKLDFCQSLEYILENIHGGINLEIKYPQHEYNNVSGFEIPNYVNCIINVVEQKKFSNIFFSTFHPLVAIYLKMKVPEGKTFFLVSNENFISFQSLPETILSDAIKFCLSHNLSGLVIDFMMIKNNFDKFLSLFENTTLYVCVYNVKTKEEYLVCKKNNITGVIVDDISLIN